MSAIFVFTTKTTQPCPHIHINCKHLNWGVNLSELDYAEGLMSKDLARQISRDLLSDCFTMILTAGLYCDCRAHKVLKVRVVKYMVVCGQIKAADQKYCHNQKWRRKLKEISFRTRVFETILMIFG